MPEPTLLSVQSVSKSYGATQALKNVSFDVASREALGYVGANGSGKSTTVKILLGLTQPTSGTVTFNGADIHADIAEWRKHLGYVPELPAVYPYLSAMEHLELVGRLRSLPEPQLQEKARELLNLLSLWDARDMPMAGYSKGMKQRVLISAALIHNPEVLILDEPLSGLDGQSTLILKRLIVALRDSGKCILYCSHTIDSVEAICNRIAVLRNGEISAYGATDEVRAKMRGMEAEQNAKQLVAEQEGEAVAKKMIAVISG